MTNILAGRTHQYLRSEYIQPPPGPPSLDAKKSPLALLAQTCSAIGMDNPKTRGTFHPKKAGSESPISTQNNKGSTFLCNDLGQEKTSFDGRWPKEKNENSSKHRLKSPHEVGTSKGPPSRKLSAPVFSKTSIAHSPPMPRTSPNILQNSDRSYRTVSTTAKCISDGSSPDIQKDRKTSSSSHNKDDKRVLSNKPKHATHVAFETARSRNADAKRGSDTHVLRTNRSDIENTSSSSSVRTKSNVSPSCILSSNSCGCTSSTSSHLHSSSGITKPTSDLSSFPPISPPCDGRCAGCPIPQVSRPCGVQNLKQLEPRFPLYPFDAAAPASMVGISQTIPSYNNFQNHLGHLWAAMAGRNDYLIPGDSSSHPHICKWVTAAEGNCGKRFSRREELLEHLSTHALATVNVGDFNASYSSNLLNSSISSNHLAAYLNGSAYGLAGQSPNSISNHLTNVALANQRFLQSSQRTCSPLYRYHPYKAAFSSSPVNPYISLFPAADATPALYGSPYSFY